MKENVDNTVPKKENPADKTYGCMHVIILLALCFQNAGHALLTRFSRGVLKEQYNSTELVIVAEFIKLIFSGVLFLREPQPVDGPRHSMCTRLLYLLLSSSNIIVLVVIYAVSNILVYYALARVDASLYTVISQLKILTTAMFAVVFLGRSISMTRWRALMLLVIGCILVASPSFGPECTFEDGGRMLFNIDANTNEMDHLDTDMAQLDAKSQLESPSTESSPGDELGSELEDEKDKNQLEVVLGVLAVFAMTVISGFSGVYFEAILKPKASTKATLSIWGRNFQLAFYSLILLFGVLAVQSFGYKEYGTLHEVKTYVPFSGWGPLAIAISLTQALGGLLVALALKYTDAVLKVVATSGSIVLSTILGSLLLGGKMDGSVILGVTSTIIAICNYTFV